MGTSDAFAAAMGAEGAATAAAFDYSLADQRWLHLTRNLARGSIDCAKYECFFGTDPFTDFPSHFPLLEDARLVRCAGQTIDLTPEGMFYADSVAGLLAHLRGQVAPRAHPVARRGTAKLEPRHRRAREGPTGTTMSTYVFFEIGRARIVPFVEKPLTSFVHDWLERRDHLGEDAAHIIRSLASLPAAPQSPRALADEMLGEKDLAAIPSPDEPALVLDDAARRTAIQQALARIQGMFWGPRIPVEEACATIREWIRGNLG